MSRMGPTRFDARSSRGGWPEWSLGEHPPARTCSAGASWHGCLSIHIPKKRVQKITGGLGSPSI